jgi:hypothetical protein
MHTIFDMTPAEAEALIADLQDKLRDSRIREVCEQAQARWRYADAIAKKRSSPMAQKAATERLIDQLLDELPHPATAAIDALVEPTEDDWREFWHSRLCDEGRATAAMWLLANAHEAAFDADVIRCTAAGTSIAVLTSAFNAQHPPLSDGAWHGSERVEDLHEAVRRLCVAIERAEKAIGTEALSVASGAGAGWLGSLDRDGQALAAVFTVWLAQTHTAVSERPLQKVA